MLMGQEEEEEGGGGGGGGGGEEEEEEDDNGCVMGNSKCSVCAGEVARTECL
jgi:hypothetical protein